MRKTIIHSSLVLLAIGFSASSARAQTTQPVEEQTLPQEKLPDLLLTSPSGLTAEKVGERAAKVNHAAKVSDATLLEAAAKVDQAWTPFLPKINLTARYLRLSDFQQGVIGSGSLLGTTAAPGTVNPTSIALPPFRFPNILNNYTLQATIAVPVSDYFLRICRGYTASLRARTAAEFDQTTARLRAATEAKIAFYNWLRARSAVVVAEKAQQDQQAHLEDVKLLEANGMASRADLMRSEAAVAGAELQVAHTQNLAKLSEKNLRLLLVMPAEDSLVPGETLNTDPPRWNVEIKSLEQSALNRRLELKSLAANREALAQQKKIAYANYFPSVAAIGDLTYANPNQRLVPQSDRWQGTWAVGAQLTWSPNDVVNAPGTVNESTARLARLDANLELMKDGIRLEVTKAAQDVQESDVALVTSKRQLAAAEEGYRVARELFRVGKLSSVALTDVETELTRARLALLNAQVDARISRTQLAYASGSMTSHD